MIGLPTETDEDLRAIADLAVKALRAAPPQTKRLQVTVALSTFVPKAHTPFQWEPQIGMAETERRLGVIRAELAQYKKITVKWHEPGMTWLEGVFARGGRELAPAVERAYRLGALFCSWVDKLELAPWRRALAECGLDEVDWLGARDLDAPLPWDHLRCGVSRKFLRAERERAVSGLATPDCRFGQCFAVRNLHGAVPGAGTGRARGAAQAQPAPAGSRPRGLRNRRRRVPVRGTGCRERAVSRRRPAPGQPRGPGPQVRPLPVCGSPRPARRPI